MQLSPSFLPGTTMTKTTTLAELAVLALVAGCQMDQVVTGHGI
jgi:hypothetical protein